MPSSFELMHLIEIEGVLVGKIFSGYLREVIMYKKNNTLCKLFCTKTYTLIWGEESGRLIKNLQLENRKLIE